VSSLAIKKEFHDLENHAPQFTKNIHIDKKTRDDYLAFFTQSSGADMLPYVYMESCDFYNNLIKNCEDYYLCKNETEIIKENLDKFVKHFSGITDIIEIGPGSAYAVNNKTLPILNCAKNLKRYHAIDHSKNYLEEACLFIEKERPDIEILGIEANLVHVGKIKVTSIKKGTKALLFLGSTLGNFNTPQQDQIIEQFSNLLSLNDILIITVDTNQDEDSLLKAYSNNYTCNFVIGALNHYGKINHEFNNYLSDFEVKTTINKLSNSVEFSFVTKKEISFHFKGYGGITLLKGQELKGIRSYKYTLENITSILSKRSFEVIETLNNSNKMQTFICKKV
jgi:L-histidine N-alpha-methyltransferase